MTESDWLAGKSADRMLEFVSDRLSPRQWRFLTCGLVRKVSDLLPPSPFTDAIDWVELQNDDELDDKACNKWAATLQAASVAATAHAEAEMRGVVRAADPDAVLPPGSAPDPDDLHPSRVLFDAGSRHAAQAVAVFAAAAQTAAQATMAVLQAADEVSFGLLQEQVLEALTQKAAANQAANNALKLKQLGDEFADNYNPKTERLDRSKAVAHVGRIDEAAAGADPERSERIVRKHVARLLLDIVGNPFRTVRFDKSWRTSDAASLATAIFAERAFDRLPILADALLDADCDEEALLRHCRGTELHLKETKEAQPHVRGCWVVELVLGRWQPLKPAKAKKTKKTKRPDWLDMNFDEPNLRDKDRFA